MEQAPAWLDALPVPAGVHREGRWLHVNQPMAALFGASSPGEIAGRLVFAFVHPSERARAEAELAPILARGEPLSVARIRLVRLDGGDLWARVESVPFAVDGGRLCVIVDMSELVREHEENMLLHAAFAQTREPIMLLDR
ncbi:MAG: PAS domain-containing protein, partial [Zetaproteobacteria bacterium]